MSESPKALPSHITHSLTHIQGLTNKHPFVCLRNVFWIRRYQLGLEGAYGQFQFIMQISIATILLQAHPGTITELIICSLVYFISFCALSFNSIFISLMHPLHQLRLNKGAYMETRTDRLI